MSSPHTISELGVGINVLPHAVRELTELGLLDGLAAVGISTGELVFYSKHGQRIWGEARGRAAGYHWPQFSIHRGELLQVLHRAVAERLGQTRVHTGHHLVRFGQAGEESGASSSSGPGTPPRVGSRPTCLWPATVSTRSSASSSTLTRARPSGTGLRCGAGQRGQAVSVGPHDADGRLFQRRVVVYPISKRHEDRGQALINWVAEFKVADDQPMPPQDWAHTARLEERPGPLQCVYL